MTRISRRGSLLALAVLLGAGCFAVGRETHTRVEHLGYEIVYRPRPPITRKDTASDVLAHFAGKGGPRTRTIGLDDVWPVRRQVWSNGRSWTIVLVWRGGPEPTA